jgi:threonine/homoserine/homoserine lactone efflux protein
MNKKTVGIVLIIIGAYLSIGNTIGSILFNSTDPICFFVLVILEDHWRNWWNNYGLITVIIIAIGLILIIFGLNLLKKSKKSFTILKEIPQIH